MLKSPEFKELLKVFRNYEVKYLVVGGFAVMRYTEPRFTKDLDLWIATDAENAERVYDALKEFGAPLMTMTPHDFTQEGCFYQMGVPPFRVDVIMSIPGIDFNSAWKRRVEVILESLSVPFISRMDLIKTKKAAGRPQDLIDAENLEKAGPNDKLQ